MKKYMIALGSMLIISSGICSAITAEDVKNEYKSAIDFAFFKTGDMNQVKKTFYNYPLGSTAIDRCNKAIAHIKSFVKSHSKNLIGAKNTLLNNATAKLEKVMNDTINAVNEVYNNKQLDTDIYLMQLDTECRNTISMLEKENFGKSKQKEAQDMLMFALDLLSNVITTAQESSAIARRA